MLLVPQVNLDNPNKGAEALPYAIDQQEGDLNLAQIVDVAIQHLSKHDRFFMMAEGGKIDYAGHGNDGATNIQEVLDFDRAIQVAYRFYEQHPDETLIVVTADHETGGTSVSYKSYPVNQPEGIQLSFSTKGHSGTVVPIFAYGAGAEKFAGIFQNKEIPGIIEELIK